MFPIYFSTRPKQLQELQVALDNGAAVLDANSLSQRGLSIVVTTEEVEGKMPQRTSVLRQKFFFNEMIEVSKA